jgi:hypothetical protein
MAAGPTACAPRAACRVPRATLRHEPGKEALQCERGVSVGLGQEVLAHGAREPVGLAVPHAAVEALLLPRLLLLRKQTGHQTTPGGQADGRDRSEMLTGARARKPALLTRASAPFEPLSSAGPPNAAGSCAADRLMHSQSR